MSVKLSRRLLAICDMVPPGSSVCDVGCDHALVDIYLLQEGKIKKALAMDIADGPLAIARQNLELTGLSDRCEVRKSDGLKAFHPNENDAPDNFDKSKEGEGDSSFDTLIIAGMGGILMRQILEEATALSDNATAAETSTNDLTSIETSTNHTTTSDNPANRTITGENRKDFNSKIASFRRLILSPQSEPWLVRDWLIRSDIGITKERLIEEDGKFYPILYCVPGAATVKPDWEVLAARTAALSEREAQAAHVDSQRMAVILRDPGFQHQAELDYGPALLAKADPTLSTYIRRKIRSDLAICQTLAHNKDSTNACSRLSEVQAELGILQVLLFVQTRLFLPAH